MKKSIILALLCITLFLTPALSAVPTTKVSLSKQKNLPVADYDGTFIGGYGLVVKENEEWQFEYYGYVGGIYKDQNNRRIMHGRIYNMEQEHIGNITIITAHNILMGKIRNLNSGNLPVIGFLLKNDNNLFIGRFMSLFGPAPNIWGKFTPN